MADLERWWRLVKLDGSSLWMPEDPSDRLTAAWEHATVEGPFVPEVYLQGAVDALEFAQRTVSDPNLFEAEIRERIDSVASRTLDVVAPRERQADG